MASQKDNDDRRLSLFLFLGIATTIVFAGLVLFFVFGPMILAATAPGIGLKSAAVIAFVLALVVVIVMAIAAGDGFFGELPAMLLGFAGFFLICWLMVAWIF